MKRYLTWQVAWWEFRRFFKWKDQVIGLAIFLIISLGYLGVRVVLSWGDPAEVRLAVLNLVGLPLQLSPQSRIRIEAAEEEEEALRSAVAQGELDGLLIVEGPDRAELFVARRPDWESELIAALGKVRRQTRLEALGLEAGQLEELMSPFPLDVRVEGGASEDSGLGLWPAIIFISLMLWGVLAGNAYLFTGITGEKQSRVTEQIVSAIEPQIWIDGKILGHSLLSLNSVVNLAISALFSNFLLTRFGYGFELSLPSISLWPAFQFAVLALLGFFFWFTFFAAIAATIDDPNTSARSSLIMLPLLPLGFAFAALGNPDLFLLKILGVFPLTSPTLLPVRIVLGEVAWWEFPLALALLLVSVWLLRRAAGKIFALGILMYGKEPSWSEMKRQLRS